MLSYVSKSTRCLAIATVFSGLGGCASDGGLGELATIGALGGSMIPGVDSGTVTALGAVAVGSMVVVPLVSDAADEGSSTPPAVPPTNSAAGATSSAVTTTPQRQAAMAKLIASESVDKYQGRSCDYLLLSLSDANLMLTSAELQEARLGELRKAAVTQILPTKNCPPLALYGGRIGAQIDKIDPVSAAQVGAPTNAVLVMGTLPGSNAQKAGIAQHDVVVEINGQPVTDSVEFRLLVGKSPIGSNVKLKLWRAQAFKEVTVVVGT